MHTHAAAHSLFIRNSMICGALLLAACSPQPTQGISTTLQPGYPYYPQAGYPYYSQPGYPYYPQPPLLNAQPDPNAGRPDTVPPTTTPEDSAPSSSFVSGVEQNALGSAIGGATVEAGKAALGQKSPPVAASSSRMVAPEAAVAAEKEVEAGRMAGAIVRGTTAAGEVVEGAVLLDFFAAGLLVYGVIEYLSANPPYSGAQASR